MKLGGCRTDGALRVLIPGGMTIVLKGDRASPPLDDAEADRLGPWLESPARLSWQERQTLAKRLDQAHTVPAHTLRLRAGEGSPPVATGSLTDGGVLARLDEIVKMEKQS